MAGAYAQALQLSGYVLAIPVFAGNASININSNVTNWSFMRPVGSTSFDAVGGIEHELNEVLGGGGAGSVVNALGNPFFANKFGSLNLYRYSARGSRALRRPQPQLPTSQSMTA